MPSRRLRVGGSAATVVPSLVASRVSGTAPLAVHFDATASTSSAVGDAFRQVTYTFDYGDSGSGTWSTNSQSKNSDSGGPLGAHVYETAGTYTVTVTADDGTTSASTTVSVTVSNPDTVYSGTNTICIDPTGGTTGGPSGCTYATSMPTIESNKRYLIKRGQTIAGFTVPRTVSGVRIGAYGSGAKPIISGEIFINANSRPTTAVWAEDIVIADLNPQAGISNFMCGRHLMVLRCDLAQLAEADDYTAGANNRIEFGANLGYWSTTQGDAGGEGDPSRTVATTSFYVPRYLFVIDCYQRGDYVSARPPVDTPNNALVGAGDAVVSMGNDFLGQREHAHRLFLSRKSLIQHNLLQDRSVDGFRMAIKMHSGGVSAWTVDGTLQNVTGSQWKTYMNVIRRNTLGLSTSNNDWTVQIGPQGPVGSTTNPEGVEDVIVENNTFINSPGEKSQDITAGPARRVTTRSNVLTGGAMRIGKWVDTFPTEIATNWDGPYYGQYTG